MKKLNLNESFISRIWMNPSNYGELKTTEGKNVEVLSYGKPNYDSGADFTDSLIKIDGVSYSGDVEIHCSLKDWKLHNHTKNRKYNRVILNVVMWGEDKDDYKPGTLKRTIPTVVLSEFLNKSIHEIWKEIINNPVPASGLPCSDDIGKLDGEFVRDFLNDLGMERLKYRAGRIKQRFDMCESEQSKDSSRVVWEKILLEFVFEALGFSKNKTPFLKLSRMLDTEKLSVHCDSIEDTDAVLFGASGLIQPDRDSYVSRIKAKWSALNKELRIESMDRSEWNYFRLRPVNFPTLRMAYASGFLYEIMKGNLFKRIIFCFKNSRDTMKDISNLLSGINYSGYWKTHYDFGKLSGTVKTAAGQSRIEDIIVNVIIPLVYVYSREFRNEDLFLKMKKLYRTEEDRSDNTILKDMKKHLGLTPGSICESQGIIHLHNFYCTKEKCSECKIGEKVIDKFSVSDAIREITY